MTQAKTFVWTDESGTMRIAQSDISLDSVVYAFRRGDRPESIQEQYPGLTLEEVFGALTYYLGNRGSVDAYLESRERLWQKLRQEQESKHDPLIERLRALRSSTVNTP